MLSVGHLASGLILWLGVCGFPVMGAEFEEDFMQTVEDTHKSLSSNLVLKSSESSLTDARLLAGYFAEIEQHFVERGDAADGIALAHKSRELVDRVLDTVAAADFATAANASSELGKTCKECHRLYKQD